MTFPKDANRRMMISAFTLAVQASLSATATIMGAGAPAALGLANVVVGTLGGLAGNSLVTDLHERLERPASDPEARRWSHDILRASALAISDIINGSASEFNTATQASVTELAKVVASCYDHADDAQPMAVVTEAEVHESLAKGEAFLQEQAGEPALWTAFLHHLIDTHDTLPAIKQTVLDALGAKIARRFNRQLFEVLKFDFDAHNSPTRGRAYASVTLRLLMNAAQSDHRLLTMVAQLQNANDVGHHTTHEKLSRIDARLEAVLAHHNPVLAYCAELERVFEVYENLGLPPPGNPDEKDEPLSIRKLFVGPAYTRSHYSPEAFNDALTKKKNPAWPLLPLLAAQQRVVLLADPGMGKSTLVQWLVSSLAAQALDPAISTPFPETVPLPFILRDLVPLLGDDYAHWTWPALLDAFKRYKPGLTATGALAAPLVHDKAAFTNLLRSANVFFLIDGLDEIGDPTGRQALRNALWQGFRTHPQARFLITSRIVGYDEAVVHERREEGGGTHNFANLVYLAPFDDAQQDMFARQWYLPRLGLTAGAERAALFMAAVRRHPSTKVIGRVPNLLYLLALLYRHKAHLPDGRAQVYAAISDAYLEGITIARQLQHQPGHSVPYTLLQKEGFLATIAMHMQVRRAQLEIDAIGGRQGEVLATSQDLREWLAPSFEGAETPEGCVAVDAFIDYVARRAGLLLPRGEGAFAFAHLSFQEYYAARHLKAEFSRLTYRADDTEGAPAKAIQADANKLIGWSRQSAWREVFIFMVESQKDDSPATWALVRKVFLVEAALQQAKTPDQDGQPHHCLPWAAADLLASLSINRDVSLSDSDREKIWSSLWLAYLRWPIDFTSTHDWNIASALLDDTPFFSQVIHTLTNVFTACQATQLSLEGCAYLSDLSFVAQLSSLRTLDLYQCTGVATLEPLRQLTLDTLDISECTGLVSLEPLSALPLRSLYLRRSGRLTSLELLRGLPLQLLYLSECAGLTNLEPLSALPLHTLTISGCKELTDLKHLSALPLHTLTISECKELTDLKHLSALPLHTLTISGCAGLTSLEPLMELPLRSLDLRACSGITPDQVEAFRSAKPGCQVKFYDSGGRF
ncbi:MAG: NACHT domain-containing protein [Prosthecobacter sp.]